MTLAGRINQWLSGFRHKRGFGIHSPFAYRFITETLHQEHAYYAYSRLSTADERLLFRIVLALRPASVALVDTPALRKAVKFAMPSVRFTTPEHAELVVASGSSAPEPSAAAAFPHLVLLGRRDPAAIRLWQKAMPCGMSFDNGSTRFVAVARTSLPRQDFSVRF